MKDRQAARGHNQATTRLMRDRRNGALNFPWLTHADWPQLHSERWPDTLDCGELTDSVGRGGVPKDDKSLYARQYLSEELEQFCARSIFELGKTGSVAARAPQTFYKTRTRPITDPHKHDREPTR